MSGVATIVDAAGFSKSSGVNVLTSGAGSLAGPVSGTAMVIDSAAVFRKTGLSTAGSTVLSSAAHRTGWFAVTLASAAGGRARSFMKSRKFCAVKSGGVPLGVVGEPTVGVVVADDVVAAAECPNFGARRRARG